MNRQDAFELEKDRPGRGCSYYISGSNDRPDGSLQDNVILQGESAILQDGTGGDRSKMESEREEKRVKPRVSPEEMRRQILDMCQDRYVTRKVLAEVVQRNPNFLGQRYLYPMVEEGLLELRYPDQHTHRNQAYRASRKTQREREE